MKKKAAGVIGIICATAIILLSLFVYYQGSDYAIQKVKSFISHQFNVELDIYKISINFWQQEIKFHNIQIYATHKKPLASCHALKLTLHFWSFLSDTIQIKEIQIIRPRLLLSVDENSPFNLQQMLPFFSLVDHLMKKRIFSIRQAHKKDSIQCQSINLVDGTLFFSRGPQKKSFRLKNVMLNISQKHIRLSGIVSHAGKNDSETQILKFKTSGSYSEDNLAHSIMTLMSSHSSEIFYEHLLAILRKLHFQSDGTIQLSKNSFQQFGHIKNKISGNIVGNFKLEALSDSPKLNLSIEYSGGHIENIPITKILLRMNLEKQLLAVDEFLLKLPDSQVSIQGIINLKKLLTHNILKSPQNWKHISWHFVVDSQNFPVNQFHPDIPDFCRFNGQVKINGNGIDTASFLSELHINGHTHIPPNRYFLPETTIHYQTNAHADSKRLTVNELTAQTEGMALTANGQFDQKMMGTLEIHSKMSEHWLSHFGLPSLSSDLHTALSIHRSISETHANIKLTGKQLTLDQYQLGDLNVDATLSTPGKLNIQKASISQPSSFLEIKGFLDWNDLSKMLTSMPNHYDLSIHSNEMQLHEIYPGLSGYINLEGNIMGSKQESSGQISLAGQDLNIFGQRINAVLFPVQLSLDHIHMTSGIIQMAEKEQIQISFMLDKEKNYQVNMDSNPIALSHLKGCIPDIQGKFQVNINGKGNVKHPELNGKVVVSPILFQNKPLPDALFKISTEQDILKIDCQSMLDFHALYSFQNGHLDIRTKANKMKLAPFLASFGLSQFKGEVSGIFQMAGQIRDIFNAQGRLQIDHAALIYNDFPLAWIDNFDLIIQNNKLTASNYTVHFPEGGYCRGNIFGQFPKNTNLNISSSVPLAVIRNFTDSFSNISGHLKIDGTLYHLLNSPMFEGQISIVDGELYAWSNQRIHHIQGQINAKDHILSLNHFSLGIENGHCELKGNIALKKDRIDLKMSASAIPIYIPDTAELMLNAQLQYSSRNRKKNLSGNLEILEGLYYQDFSLNQILFKRIQPDRRQDLMAQICQIYPPICGTELDISIQSRSPLIADNGIVYMEVHPDLSIRGTLYNPVILGRTEMINGETTYFGKTFVFEKGLIDFENPYQTDPIIDIQSNVTVRDWQISLDVLGKPDELQIKLSSIPAETHENIISILLFGKPTHQLFVPEDGPYKSTQQMLAELLSRVFEENIKETTGLDTFHLEAHEHETIDDNLNDDYKITLGKELSRRMSVTYAFETRKGQLIHHTRANYKILENLIIQGMQDTQGTYGGELLLRMEFREMPGF